MPEPTNDARSVSRTPPSFTPQEVSGRPGVDDAIPVGHAGDAARLPRRSAGQDARGAVDTPGTGSPVIAATSGPGARRIGRPDDGRASDSRITRQSSREVPVTGQRKTPPPAQPPRSVPPRGSQPPQSIPPPRGRGVPPRVPSTPPGPAAQGRTPEGPPPSFAPGRSTPVRQGPPGASAPRPGGARPAPARSGGKAAVAGYRAAPPASAATRPDARLAAAPSGGYRVRKRRVAGLVAVLVLVALIAWPVGLLIWANGKIQHVEALSGAEGTPGTTYLLAGSDARGSGGIEDETSGARTDTIMLLHKPSSGPTALISLPRDTYAEVPGYGGSKLNAAYAYGGAPLLVQTVEGLSGLTVDHYVEVGFGGIQGVVDAVGGVNLCLDYAVPLDPNSGLMWPVAGCRDVDGATAIAFSRMRYSDPKGDVGRAERQRQLIGKLGDKIADPAILINPVRQVQLADAGLGAIVTDEKSGVLDLGGLALAFRAASGPEGITGTPPISSMDYRPGNVGSTVQLNPETVGQFWVDVRDGNLAPGQVGGVPQ
ncbi:LCP family protein [Antribacter gilvus]|uniref:LCP family protein n=1 Tax=Antribacter gilvus TaxID=2304675 RepID=UPI000F7909AE|nr:LCP family protein [Antribacter gilvus]